MSDSRKKRSRNSLEKKPAIEFEPHIQKEVFERDLSERSASLNLGDDRRSETLNDFVERSVWDEPALGGMDVIEEPSSEERLTYAKWLKYSWDTTSVKFSWMVTVAIILCAGPLAILGAVFYPPSASTLTFFQMVLITVIGPTTEEIAKIALALWVIEKRPFWFRSPFQIFICAVSGGLVFAAIENAFYLENDLFNWENGVTVWRWTICVLLHSGCCFISSLGLIRIWNRTLRTGEKPEVQWGAWYIMSAIIIHGVYNTFAIFLEIFDYQF